MDFHLFRVRGFLVLQFLYHNGLCSEDHLSTAANNCLCQLLAQADSDPLLLVIFNDELTLILFSFKTGVLGKKEAGRWRTKASSKPQK